MNDQYPTWHERGKTMENEEQFHEEPVETPLAQETSEPVQEAVIPEEKTEPWKTSFPAPSGQVNVVSGNPDMLLNSEEMQHFRARWNEVQATFVDEPASSVREADALVAEVMAQITKMFADHRQTLESQWSHGNASTEDLRQILQSYRSFFNRLLK